MNSEQDREFQMLTTSPVIHFGSPDTEKNKFTKHETSVVKIKYEKTKASKRIQNRSK